MKLILVAYHQNQEIIFFITFIQLMEDILSLMSLKHFFMCRAITNQQSYYQTEIVSCQF